MNNDGSMLCTAAISNCGTYRYTLTRTWDSSRRSALWVMLNPSTADAHVDDPTIRKCIGFARLWGYGAIEVVNLFAMRATDPKELDGPTDPLGPSNDGAIAVATARAGMIVAAWGANAYARCRAKAVLKQLHRAGDVYALRVNKDGSPQHPLYVPYTACPVRLAP